MLRHTATACASVARSPTATACASVARGLRGYAVAAAAQTSNSYDAIVVGAGHNGLVAANYFARAGKRVLVLERRNLIGGAAVTEEIVPGWKFSRASYVYSLFRPHIVNDLKLHQHGLKLLPRLPSSFTPTPEKGGASLTLGGGADFDYSQIAQFSTADAAAYARYNAQLDRYADFFRPLLDMPPPEPWVGRTGGLWEGRPWAKFVEMMHSMKDLGRVGEHAARTLGADIPDFLTFLLAPASRVLDGWFSSDILKATLATDAVIGALTGPSAPQSAYVLLHHIMCGAWFNVQGGMGALSQALYAAAAQSGKVDVRVNAPVRRFLLKEAPGGNSRPSRRQDACAPSHDFDYDDGPDAAVEGVQCEDGTVYKAPIVFSTAAPKTTFLNLLEAPHQALSSAFLRRIQTQDVSSGVCKINVAVDRLPQFIARLPNYSPPAGSANAATLLSAPESARHPSLSHLRGTIHFEQHMGQIEQAYADTATGLPSRRPIIEMTIPSVLDPSVAPEGKHTVLLFVQYTPYNPRPDWQTAAPGSPPPPGWSAAGGSGTGNNWDAPGARDAFADRVFGVIDEFAPGFSSSVVGRDILTPPDLERVFGLPGGNIFHSSMGLDQLYWLRPAFGYASHRTPVAGLYLAGAGAHPGGGVMGAAGHNAALQALRDGGMQRKDLSGVSSVPILKYE